LDSYYFTKYFKAKEKKAQKVVESVKIDFGLNEEQERAFKLVANHSIAEHPSQLKMYLGGVGGTGKSQVIKALQKYFVERGEAHRFLVLAPTGTAAALLGGSTYHSVLGIVDGMDSERQEGIGIRKIQERLRGVDYIFLDEVSMVSCAAMYAISAKLALALN
ncbi:P-loop containing nucleoside triphosphate hydrolase protein, partial [Mycena epipterygia]